MIIQLNDREARALYNLIALGKIDVDREIVELQKKLEFFVLGNVKKNQFPALGHKALCDGYTELARAEISDGN